MVTLKCCVSGCDSTSATHRLFNVPKDDKLRNLWMSLLVPTNPLLIGLSKEQLLRKRVCHRHFERIQLDGQGRRTRYSYPCLFTAKEIEYGMPLSSEEYNTLVEHNYCQKSEEDTNDNEDMLLNIRKTNDDNFNEHSYVASTSPTEPENSILSENIAPFISEKTECASPTLKSEDDDNFNEHSFMASTSPTEPENLILSENIAPLIPEKTEPVSQTLISEDDDHFNEHSFMASTSPTEPENLILSGNIAPLIPEYTEPATPYLKSKDSSITKTVISKKRKLLRKGNSVTTESLGISATEKQNETPKFPRNNIFSNFDALNIHAKTLLTMQLKLVRKNKMARRFTMKEKLFALTLMKQSPTGYKMWEKMFILPTERTLNRLSQKLSNKEPGINLNISM